MWIVVGMANSEKMANRMKETLESEGVLVKLRSTSGAKSNTIEVTVLESEADLAREVLLESGY